MCSDPILCYDVGYQVNDVAWAPYSSTVFALVTGDGGIRVFDIHLNKYKQICRQVGSEIMEILEIISIFHLLTESDHLERGRPQQDRLQHPGADPRGGRHHRQDPQPQAVPQPEEEDQGDPPRHSEQQPQGGQVRVRNMAQPDTAALII